MTRKQQAAIGKVALGSARVTYGVMTYFAHMSGYRPPTVLQQMAAAKAIKGGTEMLKNGWKELNE